MHLECFSDKWYGVFGRVLDLNNPYVGIKDKNNQSSPDKFILSQNYPNPFNPITTIQYELIKSGNVVIKVFNMLGEEISELVNEFKAAGQYSVNFNASNLSSGVYFYSISTGNFHQTKKMVLTK